MNMEKKCFIIMPISDNDDYLPGHFSRVYEHLIKPACELAGFQPVRADDVATTNYIALDIIKNIIESDMALCDLSSRNPNVLYELGIRQAFNLPVTLMKDTKTSRIFDIQGFRDIEYDESLRIDTVETAIADLADLIKNTYENRTTEINSLISLLGIEPAKISGKTKISADTELILNSLSILEKRMSQFEQKTETSPQNISNTLVRLFTPTELAALKVGDELYHVRRGRGTISSIKKVNATRRQAHISFETGPTLSLILEQSTNIRKLL